MALIGQFHRSRSRGKHGRRIQRAWLRWTLWIGGGIVVLFVLGNAGMAFLYKGKVLPRYSVATTAVGGIRYEKLDTEVVVTKILPGRIKLTKDDTTKSVAPLAMGVVVDWPATSKRLQETRSWLPLLSFVIPHRVSAVLTINDAKFQASIRGIEDNFEKAALPERITFASDSFAIAAPVPGYGVDAGRFKSQLVAAVEQGKISMNVPITVTSAVEPVGQLAAPLAQLQKRLDAKITLTAGGKDKQLTRSQIGRFYGSAGQSMEPKADRMQAVVEEVAKELGVSPVNATEAVRASLYALNKSQPVTFVLAGQGVLVHTYCTAVRGVDAASLTDFGQKLAAVYGDPKGWNEANVAFVYAESGCDFTAWLSAPANMAGFGSICDNYYSCRVGANVVINNDRWLGATDPWNDAGGTLEDYRVMVINHETGHWLGFNHANCPGPGQLAPVMQQQSISLQGCSFNPWPTAGEIAALRR